MIYPRALLFLILFSGSLFPAPKQQAPKQQAPKLQAPKQQAPQLSVLDLKKRLNKPMALKEITHTPYYAKVEGAYQASYNGKKVNFPEQFIVTIPHALILGDMGVVVTEQSRPFFDYVSEMLEATPNWKMTRIQKTLDLALPQKPTQLTHESIVALASPGEHCYYHWMLEILPRLKTVALSETPYSKVFVGGVDKQYKKETLRQAGIADSAIIYGQEKTVIKSGNVIIPSMPHLLQFTRPTWVCDFVRSLFLDPQLKATPAKKRLYISRKSGYLQNSLRIITNENAVTSYLEKIGFEKIVLEDLSVKKQAELFNAAEIIVAAHGASLTNLIFCNTQDPVTLIEIYQPQWINSCYTSLTQQLNQDRNFKFKHFQLLTSTEKLSQKDKAAGNIYLELDLLKKMLPSHVRSADYDNSTEYDCALVSHNYSHNTLQRFGLVDNHSFCDNKERALYTEAAHVPTIPNLYDFTGTLEAYDQIRSAFLGNQTQVASTQRKKLYVSRTLTAPLDNPSILIDEQKLIQYLEAHGFERIALEETSIQDQAKLFNAAETIIAAEGAPLTNLIFCDTKKPVTVIEIYNPDLVNEYYATLINQLNKERNFMVNHIYCAMLSENLSDNDLEVQRVAVDYDQLTTILESLKHSE